MTLTSAGYVCDVCGDFVLPGTQIKIQKFKISGIDKTLHADDKCKKILTKIRKAGGDWNQLPDGPLKATWEKSVKKYLGNMKTGQKS